MARKVRDKALDTRAERTKLKARGNPYWRALDPGAHLGYRRIAGKAGTWTLRTYVKGRPENPYDVEVIGIADDMSDANGADVLNFYQAQERARARRDERSRSAAGAAGPLTVAKAMEHYLVFLEDKRKSAVDAGYRYEAFIKEPLGRIEVAALKAQQIRNWHSDLVKLAPRLRTRKGEEQQHRKIGKDADSKRRRQASANRTLTILKAALNMAWREGQVTSDAEWRRVEPFENVDAARIRYLKVEEAKRLINACEPDFRRLVQAALETGCRYGELTRLTCADFNPDTGTIAIRTSKTGKPRHVVLTEEGQKFFAQVCAGRPGNQLAFLKKDGSQWQKSNQKRPWDDAAERAKIDGASFHTLRHTWASLAVMAGVPLLVVAENLGHSDTRMLEKHYGHMSKSHVAEAIRAGAPRFGFKADTKVAVLGGRT
jgi:integrase